jgi:hypothetical protein
MYSNIQPLPGDQTCHDFLCDKKEVDLGRLTKNMMVGKRENFITSSLLHGL